MKSVRSIVTAMRSARQQVGPSRVIKRRVGRSRFAVAFATTVLALLLMTPTAGAHAVVTSSQPAGGERLRTAPKEVSIQFSETVNTDLGGLKVLDGNGNRADYGDSSRPTPSSVRTTLRAGLGDGTYVGNYKVVSSDGHAISGAIVFTVGTASAIDVTKLAEKNDPTFELISKVGQFITYLGALLTAGLALFVAFCYRPGPERRRLETTIRQASILTAFGAVTTIVAQAALATGGGVGSAFSSGTLGPVLRQGLGWSTSVLFIGLASCHLSADLAKQAARDGMAIVGGITIAASFVLWGHATESKTAWLAIPADVIHVAAAAVWFGGLVGLAIVLRSRRRLVSPNSAPDPTTTDATTGEEGRSLTATVDIVRRFSNLAAVSVVLLVIAGTSLAYSELGSFAALTSTTYGQTLLIKLAVVASILFLAGYNRFFLLPWLFDRGDDNFTEDDETGWRTFRRTVLVEAVGLVAVLAITAVLVNTTPGGTTIATPEPFQQSQAFRDGKVQLVITPNRVGSNSFHLDFTGKDGKPAGLAEMVTLELRLPAKDIGPITREMIKAGTGHFLLENINDLSISGDWKIALIARVSDFDQQRVDFEDTVT